MGATVSARRPDRADASGTTKLLLCGVIAGPLFVAAILTQGAVRADFDPLRHPGSSLALGEYGWIQVVNFVVGGLLMTAFAVGLRRALRPDGRATWGPLLIAAWGVGLVGAGVFLTDPVSGYPPGTPDIVEEPTWHGALHDLFSVPGFAALVIASFVFTRRFAVRDERGWAIYSAVTGVVFATSFALSGAAFNQADALVNLGGLFQRIAVVAGFAWLTALAIHVRRGLLS
jgi:hypothetical protein